MVQLRVFSQEFARSFVNQERDSSSLTKIERQCAIAARLQPYPPLSSCHASYSRRLSRANSGDGAREQSPNLPRVLCGVCRPNRFGQIRARVILI